MLFDYVENTTVTKLTIVNVVFRLHVSCAVSHDCSFRRLGLGRFYDLSLIAKPTGFKDYSLVRLHTRIPVGDIYEGQPKNKPLSPIFPSFVYNLEQLANFWEASGLRQ